MTSLPESWPSAIAATKDPWSLDLKHDAVITGPGLRFQQAHPDQGADASHPDHPAGGVQDLVPVQQDPLILRHAGPVGLIGLEHLFHLVTRRFQVNLDRRLLPEPHCSSGSLKPGPPVPASAATVSFAMARWCSRRDARAMSRRTWLRASAV
jgi:hypothetical protein